MDIEPSDYKTITDRLQIGSVRKVPHKECSESNVMRIENTVEGFKFYCFKCREFCFSSNYNSPTERLRRQKTLDEQTKRLADKDYSLPADFSRTISPKGLAWLGRGGWTIGLIQKYNIGFSVSLNRVILPIVYDGIHSGYTARAVESWQQPKYLELAESGVMWESQSLYTTVSKCVVNEDILSAGRCGEYMKAYAMLGTTLDTEQLNRLAQYDKVYVWLDNDKGGRDGMLRIVPRLRMFSDVRIIKSEVDPKMLMNNEIRRYLDA